MGSVSKFCETMRMACEDWSLGYDQSQRQNIYDGGECDCSSLVIWALNQAGFSTGSASYTGDLSDNLTSRGWVRLNPDISTCRPGDILLNDACHVCAVISGYGWDATIAQASIDESGNIAGGYSGDQSGRETNTRGVYTYSRGWDCILRFSDSDSSPNETGDETGKLDVDGVLGPLSVSEWQRQCGTTVTGVVGGQLDSCKGSYPALDSVTFEADGSELMLEVQKRLGVPNPTGIIASGTVAMLQGWLYLHGYSCAQDKAGILGEATAKSLQRSLNDGVWAE